jgi:hypothetical protein
MFTSAAGGGVGGEDEVGVGVAGELVMACAACVDVGSGWVFGVFVAIVVGVRAGTDSTHPSSSKTSRTAAIKKRCFRNDSSMKSGPGRAVQNPLSVSLSYIISENRAKKQGKIDKRSL